MACHFLWAGRFRAAELQAIGGISLFRVSQVCPCHARPKRMQLHKWPGFALLGYIFVGQ